jgi:3-phenylpropionate/trans-cinnamate dioxygenase ferredoxin component
MSDDRVRYIYAARLDEIPAGRLRRVELEGRLILLASVAGSIYAADDDCPHISGPLDQGELDDCVLTCPIHLARFDIRDGSVLRGPARNPLSIFPVRVEGADVFVGLPDGA